MSKATYDVCLIHRNPVSKIRVSYLHRGSTPLGSRCIKESFMAQTESIYYKETLVYQNSAVSSASSVLSVIQTNSTIKYLSHEGIIPKLTPMVRAIAQPDKHYTCRIALRSNRRTNIFNILTFVEYFSRIIEN